MEENGLRLLIVDDEEAARYGIKRALEAFGHGIDEADSAGPRLPEAEVRALIVRWQQAQN